MKISVITAVLNQKEYIKECIESVLGQTYKDVEHIIVDGNSSDGTQSVIKRYQDRISNFISEKDSGIYDAINKGIKASRGDVVGILNADDVYYDSFVLEKVASFLKKYNSQSLYADLVYVSRHNLRKIIRYWKAGSFNLEKFKKGWMAPHPTFFVKKDVYQKYGFYNTHFKISSDYEIMLRFLYDYKISTKYLSQTLIKMRWGGKSNHSFRNLILKNKEDCQIARLYGFNFSTVLLKNFIKGSQFWVRG